MWFRMLHAGRAVAVIAALVCIFAAASRAQTNADLTASLEPLKTSLDLIEGAGQDARSDQALPDLASRGGPLPRRGAAQGARGSAAAQRAPRRSGARRRARASHR